PARGVPRARRGCRARDGVGLARTVAEVSRRVSVVLETNVPGAVLFRRGKVRDVYEIGTDRLVIVASDRLSAFDVVLPTPILDKCRVLTQLSNFWVDRTAHLIPNPVLETAGARLPSAF